MGVIFGTPGNDRLKGTRWADEIFGLAGEDVIRGLKGVTTVLTVQLGRIDKLDHRRRR